VQGLGVVQLGPHAQVFQFKEDTVLPALWQRQPVAQ
jgi:hypothetical protein